MLFRFFLGLVLITFPISSIIAEPLMQDKVVIITGASKGIGKGIAKVFAAEGAKLVILSRNVNDLKEVTKEIAATGAEISYIAGDITKPKDMKKMVAFALKKYGKVDVLIHNAAGIFPAARIDVMTDEEWHRAIRTNFDAVFYVTKAIVPVMKKQNYGRILYTSSISGPRVGLPTKSHYTAAKAGMNGFMKTIAIELAKYNITVNAVEPGNIMTPGFEVNSEEVRKKRAMPIPMKRLGLPEEVGYAHLFLASDRASYITGQSIIVDGGQTLPESQFEDY